MPILKDRELTKSGVSILTHEEAARRIMRDGKLEPYFKVEKTYDSKNYELISGQKVIENCFEDIVEEPYLNHTGEDIDTLVDILTASERYDPKRDNRIEFEIAFFEKTKNIKFLLRLHQLVNDFKKKNVVWGVGRGSAIASYILYLLEVHDINPCEYGIPFHEMSKERE